MKRYVVFLVIFVYSHPCFGFETLLEAQTYAHKMPQYPPIDDETYPLIPDYTTFYRKHLPTFLHQGLSELGLWKEEWSIASFKKVLSEIVELREPLVREGVMVQKIVPKPGTRFFIFGDLHADFHSFVRDLTFLQQQEVIADDFKLLDGNSYIVLNGNCIDRSPYNLEALSLIIKLLIKNPDNVIYLAGDHEKNRSWFNFSLKMELQTRIFSPRRGAVPLSNKLITFFQSLPRALYLMGKTLGDKDCLMRISPYTGQDDSELQGELLKSFLMSTTAVEKNKLATEYVVPSTEENEKAVPIDVMIKGENRTITYTPTQGLVQLISDRGAVAWNVLSSPLLPHQKLYHFFYDAYAELKTAELFSNWTIALYNQDVRTMHGFKKDVEYYVASGIKTSLLTPERMQKIYDNSAIKLGSSMDLSRTLRSQSEQLYRGLYIRLDKENWAGGMFDKLIDLEILDDKYLPYRSRKNVEKLMEGGIRLIVNPVGSATVAASLDLVRTGSILVLFPTTGAPVLRQSNLKNIIHFRPSYAAEGYALTQYAIKRLGVTRLAFFYQNDAYGIGALQGAKKALEDYGIKKAQEVPYARTDVSFAQQVKMMKDDNPDAILFFATTAASQQFILQMGVQSLANKYLLGLSDLGENSFINFMKQKGLAYIIANVVPNPYTSDLEIVKSFREGVEKSKTVIDPFALEGYINASLIIEFIRKAKGSLAIEDILKQAAAMKNEKFQGLELNFDDKTHELSRKVWIDTGKPEWEEQVVKELDIDALTADKT